MLTFLSENLKATTPLVAFCFFISIINPYSSLASSKDSAAIKIEAEINMQFSEIKKKIASLLLLGQKTQALESIEQWVTTNKDKESVLIKANELKMLVLTSFLKQESQDFFELASIQTINHSKDALKNVQKCLTIEGENFLCTWAEAKIHNGVNNSKYSVALEQLKTIVKGNTLFSNLTASLNKNSREFLDLKLSQQEPSDMYNTKLIHTILEFERSFRVKNYSLAQDMVKRLEETAPDYIDIIIFKNQLAMADQENNAKKLKNINNIYQKRCRAVTPDIARKYFFDIDFCKRSLD